MQSCDSYITSKLLKNRTNLDIILSHGLSNRVYIAKYAGENVYALNGRGFLQYSELLNKINVGFKRLSLEELFLMKKEIKNVRLIISIPTSFLDRIDNIKENVTQIGLIYSIYIINEIDEDKVMLSTRASEIEVKYRMITKEKLEKLARVKMAFEEEPFHIIKIEEERDFERSNVIKNLENSMKDCIDNRNEEHSKYKIISGENVYNEILEILKKFDSCNTVVKMLMIQSLCGGSMFFHRREFGQAIYDFIGNEGKEWSVLLKKSGNKWRAIGRQCLTSMQENKSLDIQKIEILIKEIKDIEIYTFNNIKQQIPKLY